MTVRKSAVLVSVLVSAVASCKTPSNASLVKEDLAPASVAPKAPMDLETLKAAAFARCQGPYQKPVITPVPVLDPPKEGGPEAVGMTFQEELEVRSKNLLDYAGFYFAPKPRVALNNLPMDIHVDRDSSGSYQHMTWADANPDYSSPKIQPPIDKDAIPEAGRVLTELIIGHEAPGGGWPQLFDLRSSAYVRFAGYPPQITGASFRLAAHRLWSLKEGPTTKTEFENEDFTAPEDFPVVRTLYTSVKSPDMANALVVVEGELFCGALSLDMNAAATASIVVDGYWYTRKDYSWKDDPNTGLAAYSSMLWKTEKDTPLYNADEAHDSDTMRVRYSDGTEAKIDISLPTSQLRVHDLSDPTGKKTITGWSLANEDRDPAHYQYFDAALGASNFPNRVSYKVDILESSIKNGVRLYEHWTDGEYLDNIVGVSTLREDIKKAKSPAEAVHFKYRTTAYYP